MARTTSPKKYLTCTFLMVFDYVIEGVSWAFRVTAWLGLGLKCWGWVSVRVSISYLKKNFLVVVIDSYGFAVW